jgi:hypothetical protein
MKNSKFSALIEQICDDLKNQWVKLHFDIKMEIGTCSLKITDESDDLLGEFLLVDRGDFEGEDMLGIKMSPREDESNDECFTISAQVWLAALVITSCVGY